MSDSKKIPADRAEIYNNLLGKSKNDDIEIDDKRAMNSKTDKVKPPKGTLFERLVDGFASSLVISLTLIMISLAFSFIISCVKTWDSGSVIGDMKLLFTNPTIILFALRIYVGVVVIALIALIGYLIVLAIQYSIYFISIYVLDSVVRRSADKFDETKKNMFDNYVANESEENRDV